MQSIEQFHEDLLFRSILTEKCYEYVIRKQLSGVKFEKQAQMAKRFLNSNYTGGFSTSHVSKQAVEAWYARTPNENSTNQYRRASAIRGLLIYLAQVGLDVYVPQNPSYKKSDFVPYILSHDEIRRIFYAADSIPYRSIAPQRNLVIPLLVRMLYGCGVRISEALNLTVSDVNTDGGVLAVRDAKFHKDRLVAMDHSLNQRCIAYSEAVHAASKLTDAFFHTATGDAYNPSTIYYAWRQLLYAAGISHGGRGHGPRIHDLRHTFAVRCLQKWVSEGADLLVALPYLSAYMGHVDLSSTQQYLRLLPEVYPEISDALEAKFNVIPEQGVEE